MCDALYGPLRLLPLNELPLAHPSQRRSSLALSNINVRSRTEDRRIKYPNNGKIIIYYTLTLRPCDTTLVKIHTVSAMKAPHFVLLPLP